jgi:hypothetical protein
MGVGNWLSKATQPVGAPALLGPGSGGEGGPADQLMANGPADLLFQDTGGSHVHLSAPDQAGSLSADGPLVSALPLFGGAGSASLSGLPGEGSPSSQHGILAGR